jgi:hypothetical protein
VQGRARQVRDRRLQGVETVIQRQQRVFAESDDQAVSAGRRNSSLEYICGCFEVEGFSGSGIELPGDGVELFLADV